MPENFDITKPYVLTRCPDNTPESWIVFKPLEQECYSLDFTVYSVEGWTGDENDETFTETDPDLYELLFTATVKWDGCSHVNFGDDGYLHLCGGPFWKRLPVVVRAAWNLVAELVSTDRVTFEKFDLECGDFVPEQVESENSAEKEN